MSNKPGRKRGSTAYNSIDVHVGARLRARRTQLYNTRIHGSESDDPIPLQPPCPFLRRSPEVHRR